MDLFKLTGIIAIDNAKAKTALAETQTEAKKTGQALEDTASSGDKTSSKWSTALGKLGSAAATVGKAVAVGIGAASVAIGSIGKAAIEAYADYEQLVGGIDTLFKDSSAKVQKYAANAYKTAGMSANQYMETVTSFSASLLQSLDGDTVKAAEKANMAITDMSDNANKMGTDISMIQNAYQGFAKQNYTMLDNLKLGYGGTKEEMQRLLKEAEKISGFKYDISSYADIVDAIHVVQTELGITGTTAKEASSTISGSAASMKAAWQNMLVGMAHDSANFDVMVENLIETVATFAKNIIPRIKIALNGVATLTRELAPIIIAELPGLVSTLLPELLSTATSIVSAVSEAIPGLMQSILDAISSNGSSIMQAGLNLIVMLGQSLLSNAGQLVNVAIQLVTDLASWIAQNAGSLISGAVALINTIVSVLTNPANLQAIINAAFQIIAALARGFVQNVGQLSTAVMSVFNVFGDAAPIVATATTAVVAFKAALAVGNIITNLINWLTKAKAAVLLFNATLAANPVGLVIAAVAGLAAGLAVLVTKLDSTKQAEENLKTAQERQKTATDNLKSSTQALKDAQDDLAGAELSAESAALRVERAQKSYNEAVQQYGEDSLEAREAALNLKQAKHDQEQADKRLKESTDKVKQAQQEQKKAAVESKKATDEVRKAEEELAKKQQPLSEKIKNAWNGIKSKLQEKITIPKIKMPHFGITPAGWKIGDLLQGSIPKLGIEWYAKGAILDKPTIFGANGSNLMVGGEAGKEAVAPISTLQSYVQAAVRSELGAMEEYLGRLLDVVDAYLPKAAANKVLALDTGALVGQLAAPMDEALGKIKSRKDRGR